MEDNFGTLIAHVSRLLRRSFDENVRELGITRPQWHALGILARTPGMHQSGIAEALEVDPVSVGKMLDRMQEAGLVERRADPADRRAWRIHLTDKGLGLCEGLRPHALETIDRALDGIGTDKRRELVAMLSQVRANLLSRNLPAAERVING